MNKYVYVVRLFSHTALDFGNAACRAGSRQQQAVLREVVGFSKASPFDRRTQILEILIPT